jgi:ketosteroid isomerase-like protein
MPDGDDNVSILKRAYARWSGSKGRDSGCWTELVADDVTLKSLARGAPYLAFTETRLSKAALAAYFDGLASQWEMLSYDIDQYIMQDDKVVAIGTMAWRNKATGKLAQSPKVDYWRLRDGQIVEMEEFYDTAEFQAASQP